MHFDTKRLSNCANKQFPF